MLSSRAVNIYIKKSNKEKKIKIVKEKKKNLNWLLIHSKNLFSEVKKGKDKTSWGFYP